MMEDLDLDTIALSTEIVIGPAVIHWQAQVDGMDVEFVPGSALAKRSGRRRAYTTAAGSDTVFPVPQEVHRQHFFTKRSTRIWVLD